MTQNRAVVLMVMIMIALANKTRAGQCVLVNGSFEDDGRYIDLKSEAPIGWPEVNIPSQNFGGAIDYRYFVSHGSYSLGFYTYKDNVQFDMGDKAALSQWVNLADVNNIIFDLKLSASSGDWDANVRTAVVLIDGNEVWSSDACQPDVNDEYHNEKICVSDMYVDSDLHRLSVGIKVDIDVNESNPPAAKYYTDWDYIRLECHCGGNGFFATDFTRDCYVDVNDLAMLANVWLEEGIPENATFDKCNLYQSDEKDIINFSDFAVYAESWDGNMPDLEPFTETWLDTVDPNHQWNLYLEEYVHPDGIINFSDFAIFGDDWQKSSYD